MSKAPEQVWIQTDHIPDHVALDQIDEKPDADEAHQFTSYTLTDVALAMVAAAYEAAAVSAYKDAGRFDTPDRIRALTPTAAQAALGRIVQGAVKEALQVKPLVWASVSEGGVDVQAKTGFGYYVISLDEPQTGGNAYLWLAGNERIQHDMTYYNIEQAKAAAQADYERRILSALKGGEA